MRYTMSLYLGGLQLMKKCIVFVVLISSVIGFIMADSEESIGWGSYYMPGNIILGIDAGYAFDGLDTSTSAIGLYPKAEFIITKFRPGNLFPLDLGIQAVVGIHLGLGGTVTEFAAGAGALLTLHFGFRGLDLGMGDFLDSLDLYSAVGAKYDFLTPAATGAFGFAWASGINYYLSDSLAIGLGSRGWGSQSSVILSGHLKLGPKEDVSGLAFDFPQVDLNALEAKALLYQFQAFYWSVFAYGGFMYDDSTYRVGQGTIWEVTFKEDDEPEDEPIELERALIAELPDGSRWWLAAWESDGERSLFEFQVDSEYRLLKLKFMDVEEGIVKEYIPDSPEEWWGTMPIEEVTEEDFADYIVGEEQITVRAGKYKTTHIRYENMEANYVAEWWVSGDVPGSMVRFINTHEGGEFTGELIKVGKKYTTQLGSF